jgi:hypothetical protein
MYDANLIQWGGCSVEHGDQALVDVQCLWLMLGGVSDVSHLEMYSTNILLAHLTKVRR